MQRISDILDRKYKGISKVIKIRKMWTEIVGEVLASHSEPVQIKGKTLWVLCDSPAWVQQVDILSLTLIPRIRQITGMRVENIEAKFAIRRDPVARKKTKRVFRRPDIDPADVERISNPGLRKAIKQLLEG
jgi:predicted nucleic acid-binding Zn ribbon protein